MTTAYIERTVERYDEETDTYVEDDIVCTVLVHPAEPDVGRKASAEITDIKCDGENWPHTLHDWDGEDIREEAICSG